MLVDLCARDVGRDYRDVGHATRLLLFLAGVVSALVVCIPGCSQNGATSSDERISSFAQSVFFGLGAPSGCTARCAPMAVGIARQGLGLDPEEPKDKALLRARALLASLGQEAGDVGSTITSVPVADAVNSISEGAAVPIVLLHETGHFWVVFGAIRVNDKLLCQVAHGNEPVSLFTKQVLLEGGFQEAWRLERRQRVGVPIHVGAAVVEVDKLWHNFGEILPGGALECTFRLNNIGGEAVIVDKPDVSCQCTVPNLSNKTTLAPGKTLDLEVETRATESTSLRHTIGLTLYEKGTGVSRAASLTLIGSQREPMTVTPTRLDFGLVVPGKPCSRTVVLRETPGDRFVLKEIDQGALPIVRRVEVTKDKDSLATYRLHLTLEVDGKQSGERRGELAITTTSCVRPKVTIPVVFRIEPPVKAIPSVVSVGTVAIGDAHREQVHFVSRDGQLLDIELESCPDECAIVFDKGTTPPTMLVTATLKSVGIWKTAIRVKALTLSGKEVIEIKCLGYAHE